MERLSKTRSLSNKPREAYVFGDACMSFGKRETPIGTFFTVGVAVLLAPRMVLRYFVASKYILTDAAGPARANQ